jgi:GNAT superfamily N-acetyltransferase
MSNVIHRKGHVVTVRREQVQDLRLHAMIRNSFETTSVLDVVHAQSGFALSERVLAAPFRKDYDEIEDPLDWLREFGTTGWILVSAFSGRTRVGGAVGAFHTPGADILEGRRDLAVVWDLRVAPEARRQSVGTSLLRALELWAVENGCSELKVETQNTNVPACRLYAAAGFILSQANVGAYSRFPNEVQLIWRKRIHG